MNRNHNILWVLFISMFITIHAEGQIKIARVKYQGGGDWYANKTSLPNLIKYSQENFKLKINSVPETVELISPRLFSYPWVHLTGHGNVQFTEGEIQNLRIYLKGGGFLHIDDNYGLDKSIRREMKRVFPELDFTELPINHPIYQLPNKFPNGLPKIHEHDGKPAQGFALIFQGRLICFYSFESDLGNGWEDTSVYNDPTEKHEAALKMGANLLHYALMNP